MSKIGNHIIELQESDAYRWGWDWAALNMEIQPWMLRHLGPMQGEAAHKGWDDYHAREQNA